MRINVYSQELTDEVKPVRKESNTGRHYSAVQIILHSSERLHHPPKDDDRSAVTFWLPGSANRVRKIARAFEKMAAFAHDEARRLEGITCVCGAKDGRHAPCCDLAWVDD